MFATNSSRSLTLIEPSLSTWNPEGEFDLITCIHGLHYIGDEQGLISRACSWLNQNGLFVASLDCGNLRLTPGGSSSRVFAKELRQAGGEYPSNKRLISCEGHRRLSLPFVYIGADGKELILLSNLGELPKRAISRLDNET